MLKKLLTWHWLWLLPSIFAIFFAIKFLVTYVQWSNQKEQILNKLITYKKQIDLIRGPQKTEEQGERGGSVVVGGVAIPSQIFDRNNKLIGEFYAERRSLIPIEKIPDFVTKALVASEDQDFYEHSGINYFGIFRAVIRNILSFRLGQGGSTITQQLAKVLFTSQERTIERKIFELFCAKEIENHFTKIEILEMYLNLIYMGHGNYGVESASFQYFGKTAAQLNIGEAAILIGLIPNPTRYSPITDLKRSLLKQDLVLKNMAEVGVIKPEQVGKIKSAFVRQWKITNYKDNLISQIGNFPDRSYRLNLAPFFLDHIRQKLLKTFSPDEINKGGLRIYTTLDYEKQKAAKALLLASINSQKEFYRGQMLALQKKNKIKEAKNIEEAMQTTNGAFVSVEPKTGYILTMVGGHEFNQNNQFNRALKAERQVGSLIKPFIYFLAFDKKLLTPASIIQDAPFKMGGHDFKNYDFTFEGDMTVYDALIKSRNTTALRALNMVGVNDLRHLFADLLDVPFNTMQKRIPNEIGVALGTPGFTPLEMAKAYATMVNKGKRVNTRDLLRIENNQGKILWEAEDPPVPVELIDPVTSLITLKAMTGIFEAGGTVEWVSRNRKNKPSYLDFEIAGKTGTTSDFRDAWFAGTTSDETSVIWIGNDINETLGAGRSGGSLCAPVWVNYIAQTRQNDKPDSFLYELEASYIKESFCAKNGCIPRTDKACDRIARNQLFFSGTEPRQYCQEKETDKNQENELDKQ